LEVVVASIEAMLGRLA